MFKHIPLNEKSCDIEKLICLFWHDARLKHRAYIFKYFMNIFNVVNVLNKSERISITKSLVRNPKSEQSTNTRWTTYINLSKKSYVSNSTLIWKVKSQVINSTQNVGNNWSTKKTPTMTPKQTRPILSVHHASWSP